jgi:O-antigen/teichoic acid export membrane protein
MNVGRSAFKLFLAKSSSAVIFFLGILYFTRQISADELGSFFLFLALLGILSIPADVGMRLALEKRLSEGTEPAETLGSALAFKITTAGLVAAVILLARDPLNAYFQAELAGFLAVALVLQELAYTYIHTLRGELRVGETASLEFARRSLLVVVGAVLVTLGAGVEGLVLGVNAGLAGAFLWGYAKSTTAVGRPSVERVESLVAFSKYQTVVLIGSRTYQWLDVAIVGVLLSTFHVSVYEVSWQVTLIVLLASTSIARAIFPQISQWDANAATDHIEATISKAIGAAFFLSVPALVGVLIYADDLLRFFFGQEYTAGTAVLIVLMLEKQVRAFGDIVLEAVRAIDRPDLAARGALLYIATNLVLTPLLIVAIGLVGAAVGTAVAWLASTVLLTSYLSRSLSLTVPRRLLGWFAGASLLMGAVLVPVKSVVPVTGLPILLAQIALGVGIYVAACLSIPEVRQRVIVPGLAIVDGG